MVLESTNDGDDHCQPKHIIRRAEVAPAAAAAESLVGFNRAAYVYLRPRCLSDRLVPLLLLTDHDRQRDWWCSFLSSCFDTFPRLWWRGRRRLWVGEQLGSNLCDWQRKVGKQTLQITFNSLIKNSLARWRDDHEDGWPGVGRASERMLH